MPPRTPPDPQLARVDEGLAEWTRKAFDEELVSKEDKEEAVTLVRSDHRVGEKDP